MDIIKALDEMNEELWMYAKEYYVYGESSISDAEYDQKVQKLKKFVEQVKCKPKNYILGKVGYTPIEISGFEKVEHSQKMLSLDNTFNEQDIIDFHTRSKKRISGHIMYAVEYKIDGIGYAARYENGQLVKGITRGDGTIGEDITEHLKQVNGIPINIEYMEPIEIRGELYIPKKVFNHINEIKAKMEKNYMLTLGI